MDNFNTFSAWVDFLASVSVSDAACMFEALDTRNGATTEDLVNMIMKPGVDHAYASIFVSDLQRYHSFFDRDTSPVVRAISAITAMNDEAMMAPRVG